MDDVGKPLNNMNKVTYKSIWQLSYNKATGGNFQGCLTHKQYITGRGKEQKTIFFSQSFLLFCLCFMIFKKHWLKRWRCIEAFKLKSDLAIFYNWYLSITFHEHCHDYFCGKISQMLAEACSCSKTEPSICVWMDLLRITPSHWIEFRRIFEIFFTVMIGKQLHFNADTLINGNIIDIGILNSFSQKNICGRTVHSGCF